MFKLFLTLYTRQPTENEFQHQPLFNNLIRRVTLSIIIIIMSQDDGPLASHCLATVHPFTVSPSGAKQGEQLGLGEPSYEGELLSNSSTSPLSAAVTN